MEEKIVIEITDKEDIKAIKEISNKIKVDEKQLLIAIIKSIRINKNK